MAEPRPAGESPSPADAARAVAGLLVERKQTVAVSESAAGGLISAALLSLPGASAYFLGGGVIYTRDARRGLLGFPAGQAAARGATEAHALATARAVRRRLGASWGLGESGAAGPEGNRYGDPPGHVCLAVAGPAERTATLATGLAGREANMRAFAGHALAFLEATIRAGAARGAGEVAVYGLKNCAACRKALDRLAAEGIAHRFHDLRADGLEPARLDAWIDELGWEALLNRRSATWRQLPAPARAVADAAAAAALMRAHPALIKRPVFDLGGRCLVGFGDSQMAALRAAG